MANFGALKKDCILKNLDFQPEKIRPIFKIHEKSETWLMIFLKKRLILFESPNFVWTKTIFWLL